MEKLTLKASDKYRKRELQCSALEQKRKPRLKDANIKINSPLAKYDLGGNLTCIICRVPVKSETVWKVHINSKAHKSNLDKAKLMKDNSSVRADASATKKQNICNTVNTVTLSVDQANKLQTIDANISTTTSKDSLPDNFFDDPIKDAKIRNVQYKNPQDVEWERFQKEIKVQSNMSSEIIAGEQTETAIDKEIQEIDDQIHQWERVINLEQKRQIIIKTPKATANTIVEDMDYSSGDEDDDFEEFSNWRTKNVARRKLI